MVVYEIFNMVLIKSLLLLLVGYGCHAVGKLYDNDDCVLYYDCSKAANLVLTSKTTKTEKLFKYALRWMKYVDGTRVPQICCSDFNQVPTMNQNVANHPNVKLLPESCGDIDGKRIVGGTAASLYEFPWMALISYQTREGLLFLCGGSIINSRYILTAAHCVQNKRIVGVRIGEYDIRYKTDCQGVVPYYVCESHLQDVGVEDYVIHEDYRGSQLVANDIALLRLKKPVDFSFKNAAPICLPISDDLLKVDLSNKQATVAGWRLTENETYSDILLKVSIPILPPNKCQNIYNKKLAPGESDTTENKLCAGSFQKDSCNGDSGGPLMLESKYNGAQRIIQYGIVSYGPRQCGSNAPAIYTDVTKYIGWILDHLKA